MELQWRKHSYQGTCEKWKLSSATPDVESQKLLARGPALCVLRNTSGEYCACKRLGTSNIDFACFGDQHHLGDETGNTSSFPDSVSH